MAPFESVAVSMERLHGLKRIRVMLVDVPKKSQEPFLEALAGVEVLACEPLRGGPLSRYWLTFLPQDEARIAALLKEWRAVEVVLPRLHGTAAARLAKLREDLAHAGEGRAGVIRKLQDLAVQRHTLLGLKAFWESEQRKQLAHSQVLKGHWVSVLRGYVRERDLARLEKLLHDEFHSASLTTEPPALHEDVPVSLTHPRLIRPISFLITMYGLPRYNSFDPTAYLTVTFLVFFGICFSDVGYGVMLVLLSLYIRARARAYAHIRQFANLFLLGGISTILFGAVLGSWFGDLHHYLGADNPLERAQRMFAVFDPMGRPVLALVLALVIGAVNQMYGVTLKMYGAVRVGDWFGAIFDGLMWLILLPGLIILISTIFVEISGALLTLGFVLFGIGALGLVLTQGRNEPTLLGKAIVGIISLYGIFGSYGCASFIGDTLSYCRLLALGLTTGIVAMSINLIGGMLRDVPYVGMLLFIGLLIFGHLFNFLISVLGAFIHSARLIFVEFFGRFYEGGARPFRPLSFNSASFQLKE
ncbi:MAG: hypothetical protein HYZ00_06845 [Candidatus Hydrogenedentes bacterium]|nr:hypothetical protein [Candidatus Hydrogenedentota bacterium]